MPADISRFALLRHFLPQGSSRESHWDLLLERDGAALAWAIDQLPAAWEPGEIGSYVVVRRLPDHRLLYLDYEGEVSGNRGHVTQICAGTCLWQRFTEGHFVVQLACAAWTADVVLVHRGGNDEWELSVESVVR